MAPADDLVAGLLGFDDHANRHHFQTPVGAVGLPWWVLMIVMGREVFMTIFRQAAVRKGVIISAIGSAKWKTGFQSTWVGASYFWFFAATLNQVGDWPAGTWSVASTFIGAVGVVSMFGAVVLTVYSFWEYLSRYGRIFRA
jgi:phosphatidylglycerophosphate synthase